MNATQKGDNLHDIGYLLCYVTLDELHIWNGLDRYLQTEIATLKSRIKIRELPNPLR